jgi:diamine N-acetyltransferase
MDEDVEFLTPTKESLTFLRAMARRAFSEAFAHLYDAAPFSHFLDQTYGPGGNMERAFDDPLIRWRVAMVGNEIIGYAKLSPLMAPAPAPIPGALELQQIYVLAPWQGRGVAERLMDWALKLATAEQAPEIYLTVFDHNERAKRFYRRHGFGEVGRCTFQLGDRIDDNRVWRKTL